MLLKPFNLESEFLLGSLVLLVKNLVRLLPLNINSFRDHLLSALLRLLQIRHLFLCGRNVLSKEAIRCLQLGMLTLHFVKLSSLSRMGLPLQSELPLQRLASVLEHLSARLELCLGQLVL